MIPVVLDTNILASGAVAPSGGTLATIIDLWQQGVLRVIVSAHILRELQRVFYVPYFLNRLSSEDIASYLAMVRSTAASVPITEEVHGIATHPEDDLALATAVSAKAYLITGDRGLQDLGAYRGVTILSSRAFLDLLAPASTE